MSEAPSPTRFLFGVVKQHCRFGIWSNAQCITPVYALHKNRSPPPTLLHTVEIHTYPCTYSHREEGEGLLVATTQKSVIFFTILFPCVFIFSFVYPLLFKILDLCFVIYYLQFVVREPCADLTELQI